MNKIQKSSPEESNEQTDFEEMKNKLDLIDREILTCIYQNDGRVVGSTITEKTGIGKDTRNYRLKQKLSDMGLIRIEKVPEDETNKPFPPNIGVLTDFGRKAIEQGGVVPELYQLDDTDERVWEIFAGSDPEDFQDALDRIERLENRVNSQSEQLDLVRNEDGMKSVNERLEELESQVEKHETWIDHLYEVVNEIVGKVGFNIESAE